ncbi:rhomboid family intramembrane serine protease [Litorisediminicola beolgyonensis]|uniref:Rhomboid family intramembrane serine protease n=1 Tax=Litorisediminicola beolgyonensis TaxID=1173614 RepID=A0ABW3ZKM3_9RHOB
MFPIRDHNPSGSTPYVTYLLIAANIGAFLLYFERLYSGDGLMNFWLDYALVPRNITNGHSALGFFTHMFLHGGIMHLVGNMLFLFIFGDNIEHEMGPVGFTFLYFASGLGAALLQYMAAPFSTIPMVGASGAVAGVMGAYLLMFPRARIDVIVIIVIIFKRLNLPAWAMLIFWFGLQLWGSWSTPADIGGTAYWAHIGGFVVGLVLAIPLWISRGGPRYWRITDGHPPHPEGEFWSGSTDVPKVPRK